MIDNTQKPFRVQRKRTKGWRMPENTKSVTRPGKFGNPYTIGQNNVFGVVRREFGNKSLKDILIEKNGENVYHDVEDIVMAFEERLRLSEVFQRIVIRELKGKNLACFCKEGAPCHADVLLKWANK